MQTEPTYTLWQYLTRTVRGRALLAYVVIGVAGFLLMSCSAQARDVTNTPDGRIIRGANCLLIGNGTHARGKCSVGYNPATNNTLVVMNELRMLIKRSSETGAAGAYIVEDDATLTPIATVVAVDKCWVGYEFKFCAD